MNRLLSTLILLLLVGPGVSAQTMITIPPHGTTYSSSVRGMWFTAPTNFTITGLRMPPEAGTAVQSFHVMKINDAVPVVYTVSSTNFNTLLYVNNVPNGVIHPVSIPVN